MNKLTLDSEAIKELISFLNKHPKVIIDISRAADYDGYILRIISKFNKETKQVEYVKFYVP